MAAGSLLITEAGGLIGNFTGEADYLYQREVVAGNPKVYGQLVQILAPYTRVLKAPEEGSLAALAASAAAEPDATAAFVEAATAPTAPPEPKKAAVRIRKADLPKADDAPM